MRVRQKSRMRENEGEKRENDRERQRERERKRRGGESGQRAGGRRERERWTDLPDCTVCSLGVNKKNKSLTVLFTNASKWLRRLIYTDISVYS